MTIAAILSVAAISSFMVIAMTNAPEYSCRCGARFYTLGAQQNHISAAPRKCLKADRAKLTPEQYAETPTEHAQQVALFMWAALPETLKLYPVLEYMFAIPNGGMRDKITATRLKAEGVKPGVPDIFLPVERYAGGEHVHSGLFIEMKRERGVTSTSQLKWLHKLVENGYEYRICHSFAEARDAIIRYLS